MNAIRLWRRQRSRLFSRVLILLTVLSMMACASNEALFAEYDESCYIARSNEGLVVVAADTSMPWEPAVYFGYDKHLLVATEQERLLGNIAVLRKYPQLRVSLQAFTDDHGDQAYNRRLANRRVGDIAQRLLAAGISGRRIHAAPLGEELPLAAGASINSRILNRRVEMMLLDRQGRPLLMRVSGDENNGFVPPQPVR